MKFVQTINTVKSLEFREIEVGNYFLYNLGDPTPCLKIKENAYFCYDGGGYVYDNCDKSHPVHFVDATLNWSLK